MHALHKAASDAQVAIVQRQVLICRGAVTGNVTPRTAGVWHIERPSLAGRGPRSTRGRASRSNIVGTGATISTYLPIGTQSFASQGEHSACSSEVNDSTAQGTSAVSVSLPCIPTKQLNVSIHLRTVLLELVLLVAAVAEQRAVAGSLV